MPFSGFDVGGLAFFEAVLCRRFQVGGCQFLLPIAVFVYSGFFDGFHLSALLVFVCFLTDIALRTC